MSNLGSIINVVACTFDFGAEDYITTSIESPTYPEQTYYFGGSIANP
jgi:hypothetical protein